MLLARHPVARGVDLLLHLRQRIDGNGKRRRAQKVVGMIVGDVKP
jgi:hypothetical protein